MLAYETYQPGFDPSMTYGYKCHSYGHYAHSRHNSYSSPTYRAPHNIMILGATGTIGTYITRAIVDANSQGHFGRISIYTSEKTVVEKVQDICALESMGVEIVVGSLDDERRFKDACRGVDTIVSCLGRHAIEKQIPIMSWAEENGVTRFFASEFGTDIEYFPDSEHEPPHQMKLKVRAHMKTLRRMEHTYVVTGPYSDLYFGAMKEAPKAGGFDVGRGRAYLLGDGDMPVSFTAMNDVGKFVVAALINYITSRNQTLIVHSFTATPNEILAEFEAQLKKKWEVNYVDTKTLQAMEKEAYQIHSPLAAVLTLRRIWTLGGTLHKFYDDSLLGFVETENLEDQVRLNIAKQVGRVPGGISLLRTLSAV
ncbi:hypothetical protein LTR70_004101 [Exophiala xenobiotica]|uniref:NmrA-like domain-containing protein n=1 Tax=Lithohypha guttulata TaxID=1690604 RepID=A0ABR0KEF8_9EURO|nr:hypothetical protein LTR24_003618 [Lithohypha guttulata]KAK5321546.1 hypothetical protein LTR70_004101 [Exophiala xenobiotica]